MVAFGIESQNSQKAAIRWPKLPFLDTQFLEENVQCGCSVPLSIN